ncbi:MAG: acyltransferase family protein [Deltaproteobacteria bacterium]|nr:acyltransferase family protein [Deltaproteobacteria bacterium]
MKGFFGKKTEKIFDLHNLELDKLALYVLPRFVFEIIRKYFRLDVEGLENVPSRGRAIVLPNHSGWTGLDAVMIGNEIFKQKHRVPRVLAHKAWFLGDIKMVSVKMGMIEASTENALRYLKKNNVVVLFPEGEYGNFKPSSERYHLQEFKRGFVRMALATGAPIIPTLVIGAEESNINLASLKFAKYLKGQIIPIPLNVLPLPAKWKIKFLPPIRFSEYSPKDAENGELVHNLAAEVQAKMQSALNEELKHRKWVYFPPEETNLRA